MRRRDFLKATGLAVGAAAIGCGGTDSSGKPDDDHDPLTRAKLLANIDTIVVLCMENRSA